MHRLSCTQTGSSEARKIVYHIGTAKRTSTANRAWIEERNLFADWRPPQGTGGRNWNEPFALAGNHRCYLGSMAPESKIEPGNGITVVQVESADRCLKFCRMEIVVPNEDADVGKNRMRNIAADEWADDCVVRIGRAEHGAAGGRGGVAQAAEALGLRNTRTCDGRAAVNVDENGCRPVDHEWDLDTSAEVSLFETGAGIDEGRAGLPAADSLDDGTIHPLEACCRPNEDMVTQREEHGAVEAGRGGRVAIDEGGTAEAAELKCGREAGHGDGLIFLWRVARRRRWLLRWRLLVRRLRRARRATIGEFA